MAVQRLLPQAERRQVSSCSSDLSGWLPYVDGDAVSPSARTDGGVESISVETDRLRARAGLVVADL